MNVQGNETIADMNIAKLTFNPFQENTYVLWDESSEAVIVDAGNYTEKETEALLNFLAEKGWHPVMDVNTHGHVDHMLGVQRVKCVYGIPFSWHAEDRFLM